MKKFDLNVETLTNLLILIGVMAILIMSAHSFTLEKARQASVSECNSQALAKVSYDSKNPSNLEEIFLYSFFFDTCTRSIAAR